MNLDWIRQEVSKEQEDINWLSIIEAARDIYDEENKKSSLLGLSKGYINFVKLSYIPYGKNDNEFTKEISSIYPGVKIYIARKQTDLTKLIKSGEISKDTIKDTLTVVLGEKMTLEGLFTRNNIPHVKYHMSTRNSLYKTENGSERQERMLWRKDGQKGFSWVRGTGLVLKRDNLIDELFSE